MSRCAAACRRAGAFAALMLPLLVAAPAAAMPTLYHSPGDTGADPGPVPPVLPTGSPQTVYLYVDPGPDPTTLGTVCHDSPSGGGGNGDESCGLHFRIEVTGDLSILSFSPQAGIATSRNTGSQLTAALVTTAVPLLPGPTRIGTLQVTGGPLGGTGQLAMLQTVDADLELQIGSPRAIFFIPEPGRELLLGVGLAGLALLHRLARRAGPPPLVLRPRGNGNRRSLDWRRLIHRSIERRRSRMSA